MNTMDLDYNKIGCNKTLLQEMDGVEYISISYHRLLNFVADKGLHDNDCTFYKCTVAASFKIRLLSSLLRW